MLQGWQESILGDSTLLSSAGSLNQAAVLAQLQEYLGVYADLDTHAMGTGQARAQGGIAAARGAGTYYAALKAAVISYFGAKSPQLVKFGLEPRKSPAPLTSTQLAVRAAKVKATRQLRGPKGPVQKAAIKAGPMQFSIGPVPAPAASTSPPEAAVAESSPAAGK